MKLVGVGRGGFHIPALILEAEIYSVSFWLEYIRTQCPGFKKVLGFEWGCSCQGIRVGKVA